MNIKLILGDLLITAYVVPYSGHLMKIHCIDSYKRACSYPPQKSDLS